MAFVEVEEKDGKKSWVNSDHILRIVPDADGKECKIEMSSRGAMSLKGSSAQLAEAINGRKSY